MACSCQGKSGTPAQAKTYTVTAKDGTKTSYRSEVEAAAAAKRKQGSYQPA